MYILQSKPADMRLASTDKIYYNEDSNWGFIPDRSKATEFETKKQAEKVKQELMKVDHSSIKIIEL